MSLRNSCVDVLPWEGKRQLGSGAAGLVLGLGLRGDSVGGEVPGGEQGDVEVACCFPAPTSARPSGVGCLGSAGGLRALQEGRTPETEVLADLKVTWS